jgi:KipI family sensor histidine kinase inhibitor
MIAPTSSALNRVVPYGRHALLVTPPEGTSPGALAAAIDAALRPGPAVDVVSGAATVLVTFDSAMPVARLESTAAWLTSVVELEPTGGEVAVVDIEVTYDGPDLDAVARATGLTVSEVIGRHSDAPYRCEFCGFAPGFAYLSGLDPSLALARRASPRAAVPAGSVAIAGGYTAVYPTTSPGGWHLLGRTDVKLWDVASTPPSAIAPGITVRFHPLRGRRAHPPRRQGDPDVRGSSDGTAALEVIAAGWATSVQDGGRAGLAHLGVPGSGAIEADRRAALNRLVGNPDAAAVVETAGGLVLRALRAVVVADSTSGTVTTIAPGGAIDVDPGPSELWATLAVRGGVAAAPVLGSRSWDTLAQLGPPPPRTGDVLAVGDDPRTPIAATILPRSPRRPIARVVPGPRRDWFGDAAWAALLEGPWLVSSEVSRVGTRLSGPVLARSRERLGCELPPEGLVTGAVQVPPNGQPVVMLADHPTTGGYPVIAVVDARDVAVVGGLPPGSPIAFTLG